MNAQKIVGLIAILLAIVGAFVTIPYAAAILLILGLFVGLSIIPDHHVRVMVSARCCEATAHLRAIRTVAAISHDPVERRVRGRRRADDHPAQHLRRLSPESITSFWMAGLASRCGFRRQLSPYSSSRLRAAFFFMREQRISPRASAL
jgi:hypothetical protein